MDSYDVIAEAVKGYWKDEYPQDMIVFFQQKYSWDDEWERCEELVECHGIDDYENMTFLSDFCEGQTEVKDVTVVPLREVTMFYSSMRINPITNADRIRAMKDEELAVVIAWPYLASPPWCAEHRTCPHISEDPTPCDNCALDWLKQETDG